MSSSNISAAGKATSNNSDGPSESADPATAGTVYPPQRHAGKVGYGPQYHLGPTIGERVKGYEEELKGHLTHNHELVEHGKMMVSGELKRREREHDMKNNSPFEKTEEHHEEKEQAATVSPAGSHKAEKEKKGETVDNIKHIG